MPDYQKGKIYKLYSNESPDEIYIGSTTQSLCRRKQGHKDKKNCNSKILFEKYEQVIIELIEYFPCNTREELNKKEGEYIRMTDCINKEIAGRTKKEWREENLDIIKEKNKVYREQNKDKIKEKNKKYRENNADIINQKAREKYELNKDEINQRIREKRKEKKNELI